MKVFGLLTPHAAPATPKGEAVEAERVPDGGERVFVWLRYGDGSPCVVLWRRVGLLHRTGGPAVVFFDPKGRPVREEWWVNGRRHRDHHPALTFYDPSSGRVTSAWWYVDGRARGGAWSETDRGDLEAVPGPYEDGESVNALAGNLSAAVVQGV